MLNLCLTPTAAFVLVFFFPTGPLRIVSPVYMGLKFVSSGSSGSLDLCSASTVFPVTPCGAFGPSMIVIPRLNSFLLGLRSSLMRSTVSSVSSPAEERGVMGGVCCFSGGSDTPLRSRNTLMMAMGLSLRPDPTGVAIDDSIDFLITVDLEFLFPLAMIKGGRGFHMVGWRAHPLLTAFRWFTV